MNKLLLEGLTDAIGFFVGALAGYVVGRLLGWDLFAEGYGNASIAAIVLVGLGGGLGLQLMRKTRTKREQQK
jgi:hypothetical protein